MKRDNRLHVRSLSARQVFRQLVQSIVTKIHNAVVELKNIRRGPFDICVSFQELSHVFSFVIRQPLRQV